MNLKVILHPALTKLLLCVQIPDSTPMHEGYTCYIVASKNGLIEFVPPDVNQRQIKSLHDYEKEWIDISDLRFLTSSLVIGYENCTDG